MEFTKEQQQIMAIASARKRQQEAQEKPGITEKVAGYARDTRDRLQLAASDAISTMAGDTYGRYGDPTEPDNLMPHQRVLKAAGGDVLPAVGEIAGDAMLSTADALLPNRIKVGEKSYDPRDVAAKGLDAVMSSRPAQYVGDKLDEWKESDPGSYATAGEVANVAMAGLPVKVPSGVKHLRSAAKKKSADFSKAARQKAIALRQRPDKFTPLNQDLGDLVPVGAGERVLFHPGPGLNKQADILSDIRVKGLPKSKGYDPSKTRAYDPNKTAAYNLHVTTKAVDDMRINLDEKLKNANPVRIDDYNASRARMLDSLVDDPELVGDAAKSAEKIFNKLDKIIAEKASKHKNMGFFDGDTLTAVDILDARRELDSWLSSRGVVLGKEGNITARKIAAGSARDMLNDMVVKMAPDVGVADDLMKMHEIMKARSTLAVRALAEEGTGKFRRYIYRLEEDTGLAPPRTPASIRANIGLGEAMFTAGAAGLHHVGGKLKQMPIKNRLSAERLLADALYSGTQGAQRAALIDMANKDEENN